MKNKNILDPLWITKGSNLDPEYLNYILLAASQKYRYDLEEGSLDKFYEIFFHSLNLNTLAVNGNILDFKMHSIWNNERIKQITSELKQIYKKETDAIEIFRNANYVFVNLLLDYMEIQLDVLENIDLFYVNQKIHEEPEIFIVISTIGRKKYSIWKIEHNLKKDFGYSFKKIKSINIPKVKENILREELDRLQDPKLINMKEHKNVVFALLEGPPEKMVANIIKDIFMLNRGIAKNTIFEPMIIAEMQSLLLMERLVPFTLNQWIE